MSKLLHSCLLAFCFAPAFSGGATGELAGEIRDSSVNAQIFDDLGPHRRTITTTSVETQAYFDQGLTWMYAFNHDEAIRSFMRAADRLGDLVPASGHLLHMPSHIHVKTGLWEKAIVQNEKAMRADKAYRLLSPDQTTQHVYMTHNAHLLAYAAMMSGREQEAMSAARDMWANVDEDILRKLGPALDRWMCSVFDVQKRFGHWDDILAEAAPPSYMPITTATWRAARAVAYAAKQDFTNAEREYRAFKEAKANIPQDVPWGPDAAHRVLEVSDYFVAGEIALQKHQWSQAADLLEKAVAVEDTLAFREPPQWLQPVRHTLGAVYLSSGNHAEAERVYREDLAKWPNNGWSLLGLSRALQEQGRTTEAEKVKRQYDTAWKKADAPTDTSCKCIPAP